MPPLPSTVQSLTLLAEEFLTVSEEALADTTAGTPTLSYMEAGPLPAFDCCPALIVYASQLAEDATNPQASSGAIGQRFRHGRRNLATLNVIVLRCSAPVTDNGIPDAASKTAVAATVQEDGWALWTSLYNAFIEGRFKDMCSTCYFDPGQAIADQGGCVGWFMSIRADLGGIPAVVGT